MISKQYYSIYQEAFRKRVVNEGIWLPFTPLRSIPGWDGGAYSYIDASASLGCILELLENYR